MERKFIFAKEGCWLTQSDKNPHRPRIFLKSIPSKYPNAWVNWTDEKYQEYCKEHGPMTKEVLKEYLSNFDYTGDKSFLGIGVDKAFNILFAPVKRKVNNLKNAVEMKFFRKNTEQ